jgi:hypothetical protein
MVRPQGEWPAAVFYPFGHPKPYAYRPKGGGVSETLGSPWPPFLHGHGHPMGVHTTPWESMTTSCHPSMIEINIPIHGAEENTGALQARATLGQADHGNK